MTNREMYTEDNGEMHTEDNGEMHAEDTSKMHADETTEKFTQPPRRNGNQTIMKSRQKIKLYAAYSTDWTAVRRRYRLHADRKI